MNRATCFNFAEMLRKSVEHEGRAQYSKVGGQGLKKSNSRCKSSFVIYIRLNLPPIHALKALFLYIFV